MSSLHLEKSDFPPLDYDPQKKTSVLNFKPHRGSPKNQESHLIFNRHLDKSMSTCSKWSRSLQ